MRAVQNHRQLVTRQVLVIDSFISVKACEQILTELASCCWHSSGVVVGGHDTQILERFRSSLTAQQAWFGTKTSRIVRQVETRLAAFLACDPRRLESWQATRYESGCRFGYHIDGGYCKQSAAGDRKRTYLLYLDKPEKGGETHFRALDVVIAPKPGRLVAWENLLPSGECDHAMIHSGLEVRKGTKTTLVSWERERPLRKPASESPLRKEDKQCQEEKAARPRKTRSSGT